MPPYHRKMPSKLLVQLNVLLQRIEHALPMLFGGKFPPGTPHWEEAPKHWHIT